MIILFLGVIRGRVIVNKLMQYLRGLTNRGLRSRALQILERCTRGRFPQMPSVSSVHEIRLLVHLRRLRCNIISSLMIVLILWTGNRTYQQWIALFLVAFLKSWWLIILWLRRAHNIIAARHLIALHLMLLLIKSLWALLLSAAHPISNIMSSGWVEY